MKFSKLLVCLLLASARTSSALAGDSSALTLTNQKIEQDSGACDRGSCARIKLEYLEFPKPEKTDRLKNINQEILKVLLTSPFEDENYPGPKQLADDFIRSYHETVEGDEELKNQTNSNWTLNRKFTVAFQNAKILVLEFNQDSYTGGAHSNSARTYLNFSLESGKLLTLSDIFAAGYEKTLTKMGEESFRKVRAQEISDAGSIQDAGFAFGEEGSSEFLLNDNFALSEKGLTFYFNPYEIAPYALGSTEILIAAENLTELSLISDIVPWQKAG